MRTEKERRIEMLFYLNELEQNGIHFKKPFPTNWFVAAPASSKYHGAYSGGLFDHSFEVMTALQELTDGMGLSWERPDSPIIIGLFHDLCKIDLYKYDAMNNSYSYSKDPIIDGHGEKSIIYLQKYVDLTDEEIACIRWHMGAYETDTKKWEYFDRAIRKYPNVLYTHTADMIASKIVGV